MNISVMAVRVLTLALYPRDRRRFAIKTDFHLIWFSLETLHSVCVCFVSDYCRRKHEDGEASADAMTTHIPPRRSEQELHTSRYLIKSDANTKLFLSFLFLIPENISESDKIPIQEEII
jgi:hypothetical protein